MEVKVKCDQCVKGMVPDPGRLGGERKCIICNGTAIMKISVRVPEIGDKVIVRSTEMLTLMGIPEYAGIPGTILSLNDPVIDEMDDVELPELRVTCNVTWQETNSKGRVLAKSIKEFGGIDTWGFTPLELRWV